MGILDIFFKKQAPILKEEDVVLLREMERKAYLEEAKNIVGNRGIIRAKNDYGVKEVKKDPWQM